MSRYSAVVLVLILFILPSLASGTILLTDEKKELQIYTPEALPTLSDIPDEAKPIAIGSLASSGNVLSIIVQTDKFSQPVDVYLGLRHGEDEIQFFDENGNLRPYSAGLTSFMKGVAEINIKLPDKKLESLAPGIYQIYLAVTKDNMESYLLWSAQFTVAPDQYFEQNPEKPIVKINFPRYNAIVEGIVSFEADLSNDCQFGPCVSFIPRYDVIVNDKIIFTKTDYQNGFWYENFDLLFFDDGTDNNKYKLSVRAWNQRGYYTTGSILLDGDPSLVEAEAKDFLHYHNAFWDGSNNLVIRWSDTSRGKVEIPIEIDPKIFDNYSYMQEFKKGAEFLEKYFERIITFRLLRGGNKYIDPTIGKDGRIVYQIGPTTDPKYLAQANAHNDQLSPGKIKGCVVNSSETALSIWEFYPHEIAHCLGHLGQSPHVSSTGTLMAASPGSIMDSRMSNAFKYLYSKLKPGDILDSESPQGQSCQSLLMKQGFDMPNLQIPKYFITD